MSDAIDFDRMRTLGDVARYHAEARPDETAFSFEGRDTSFATFDRHTNQVANALIAAGLSTGDRVAYVGKNSDAYFELLVGAAKAGVVTTPIGWRLAAPEMAYIVGDSEAKIVFIGPELIAHIDAVAGELTHRPVVIAMEAAGAGEHPTFEVWRDANPDTDPLKATDTSDIAHIIYTSGTTGRPKGVMRSHRAELAMGECVCLAMDVRPRGRMLEVMPMFHAGAQSSMLAQMWRGGEIHIHRAFDPEAVLKAIETEKITHLHLVPLMVQALVDHPGFDGHDLSSVETILYAAAPMPVPVLRRALARFGPVFVNAWGQTEGTGTALPKHLHAVDGPMVELLGSIGNAYPLTQVRIVGDDGQDCAVGEVGELWIRGEAVMAGYWNNTTATLEAFHDDWLKTGDMGRFDACERVFLVDRKKDMIISGGENIYSQEVERAIAEHPAVAQVAVIGAPDEKWGEAVKAVVAAKPGVTPDAEDIIAFARTRIAGFKAPKSVDFVDALPRNASGKILRRELRAPYWEGRERQVN
jgi:acyl-CoA synthetase (AMP-forming)/AMP-acid ligase II